MGPQLRWRNLLQEPEDGDSSEDRARPREACNHHYDNYDDDDDYDHLPKDKKVESKVPVQTGQFFSKLSE